MNEPIDPSRRYSQTEYFRLDTIADIRLEYQDGFIEPHFDDMVRETPSALDGETRLHNRVLANVWFALENQLRALDSPRELHTYNISTETRAALGCMYPDIVLTTTEREEDLLSVVFPALIVEVVSNGSAKADRGWKFDAYRSIDSVDQILLVEAHEVSVDCYTRNPDGNTWTLVALRELTDTLVIESLEMRLSLEEIYWRVPFDVLEIGQ